MSHYGQLSHTLHVWQVANRSRAGDLGFLLTPSFPGVDTMRQQAQKATVVGECGCGCATIDLAIDNGHPEPIEARERIITEARTQEDRDGPPLELILFAKGNCLSSIEIVYYDDNIPHVFPPPVEFRPAYARTG
jgi:hypothetical protein